METVSSLVELAKEKITKNSNRNPVLDLLRGHYLVAILIDHLHKFPSPFIYYNGKGDLWVSAASGFVFVSGMLIGAVNFPKIKKYGMPFVTKKLLYRGLKLYVIGSILTIAYAGIGLSVGRWEFLNQGIPYNNMNQIIVKTLTFQFSYGWADLLLLYAVLVFIAPVVLYLIYKGFWYVVFAVSFILWMYAYLTPGLQQFTGSYFPIASWQFLFFFGAIVGYFRPQFSKFYRKLFWGKKTWPKFLLVFGALTLLLLSVADVFYGKFAPYEQVTALFEDIFTKRELGPGRLAAFFVWFTFSYFVFQKFLPVITKYLGWLYNTYGKNSLLTYVLQSMVLFVDYYWDLYGGYAFNTLLTIWFILLVWAMVKAVLYIEKHIKAKFPVLKNL